MTEPELPFLVKAQESLAGAESEFANGRYNNCANRIQDALAELQGLIEASFPGAAFAIYPGHDPEGIYLEAMVDVDDINDVLDVYIDRLVDLQVEGQLPVYVVPVRPPERVA